MVNHKPVTFNSTLNLLEYTGKVSSIERQRVLLADFPSYFVLNNENQSIQDTLFLAQRSNKHVTISVNPMNNTILNAALAEPTSHKNQPK